MKIHYICRGNVVRSLMAETYTKSLKISNIEASSSGTVADRHRDRDFTIKHRKRTIELLTRRGLDRFAKSTSDQASQEVIDAQDLIICVNERAYNEAMEIVNLPPNTIIWHVDDIGEGQRILTSEDRTQYEEAIYDEVRSNIDALLDSLIR